MTLKKRGTISQEALSLLQGQPRIRSPTSEDLGLQFGSFLDGWDKQCHKALEQRQSHVIVDQVLYQLDGWGGQRCWRGPWSSRTHYLLLCSLHHHLSCAFCCSEPGKALYGEVTLPAHLELVSRYRQEEESEEGGDGEPTQERPPGQSWRLTAIEMSCLASAWRNSGLMEEERARLGQISFILRI